MSIQIVLLRGINVGGHNKLPMIEFTNILNRLGASDVQTYIQSGNAVMSGDVDAESIADAIETAKGFRPKVMVLPIDAFRAIAKANPFPKTEGKTLHIWFLSDHPKFDKERADALVADSEKYMVADQAIYLHAVDGIGRSKLAAAMEGIAGASATARNWNTVAKLLAIGTSND